MFQVIFGYAKNLFGGFFEFLGTFASMLGM